MKCYSVRDEIVLIQTVHAVTTPTNLATEPGSRPGSASGHAKIRPVGGHRSGYHTLDRTTTR